MWYIFPQMKGLGKSEFSGNIKDTLIAGKIKEKEDGEPKPEQ